ncbi:hypothetical protein TNCV_4751701 [Trichonephila clavipes]|nr:hypothetical protein TNCV_4751701 [Trichonephila clavipes]
MNRIKRKKLTSVRFLLNEVETDKAREEPEEIMDINRDNESKFKESDEHETFRVERKAFKCYLKNSTKKDMKPQVYHKTHCTLSKRHKQEKGQVIHWNYDFYRAQ